MMKANDVIRIGRRRMRAALSAAPWRLAGGSAGGPTAIDIRSTIAVVAHCAFRSGGVTQPEHCAERHHLTRGVADFQLQDVRGNRPVVFVRFGNHLVSTTEFV